MEIYLHLNYTHTHARLNTNQPVLPPFTSTYLFSERSNDCVCNTDGWVSKDCKENVHVTNEPYIQCALPGFCFTSMSATHLPFSDLTCIVPSLFGKACACTVSGPFHHALLRHLTEWPHQVAVVQSQSGYHGFIHNCNGPIVHMVGAVVWMYSGMVGVRLPLPQWAMQVKYIVLRWGW